MPSTAVLERKKQMVADLSERIKNSCAGVVVDYKGINVEDDTKLRKELREAGVEYTVVKNSILMQDTEIGDNSKISCVIADKNVSIKSGVELAGNEKFPVCLTKNTRV